MFEIKAGYKLCWNIIFPGSSASTTKFAWSYSIGGRKLTFLGCHPTVLAHFLWTLAESLGMKRLFEKNADLCTQTPPTWLLATRNSNPQLLDGRFFRHPAAFAFVMRFPNREFSMVLPVETRSGE
jgi:hypothetical protein